MKNEFIQVIEQISDEKGIAREQVIKIIEQALAAAYKKDYGGKEEEISVQFDPKTGEAKIFKILEVVKEVEDENIQIDQKEIKKLKEKFAKVEKSIKPTKQGEKGEEIEEDEETEEIEYNFEVKLKDIKIGDKIALSITPSKSYGRIAAQTAKQVIIQRIREAERNALYFEFKEKEGQVVNGIIQRSERENVIFDLGKAIGILPPQEQIRDEDYSISQRYKVLILEVKDLPKGPAILLSRSHSLLLQKLFELEVPEIYSGQVEIKVIAREAGSRSKVAVVSKEERVDPVGACVGQRGTRIQTIVNELSGEKIDIIIYSQNPAEFITNALAPAHILDVRLDEKSHFAICEAKEDELSLAIGKKGQNVRLAAKLTGWKIDIQKEKTKKTEKKESKGKMKDVPKVSKEKVKGEKKETNKPKKKEPEKSKKSNIKKVD